MTPDFTPVSSAYIKEYKELLHLGRCRASDYSFGNIWGWGEHYGLEWKLDEGLCWIRQTRPKVCNWAPVGDWRGHAWSSSAALREGGAFIRVPEELALLWRDACGERAVLNESRGYWDYVYAVKDLAALSGNRFHKKKNLLNQFIKLYQCSYVPLRADSLHWASSMQKEWLHQLERTGGASPALLAEDVAVARVLDLWEAIPGLAGGAIVVEGKAVAYTVGEEISPGIMTVHFEKGLGGYKGVYQAINNFFAVNMAESGETAYLNREQDLDDPGLRQAKESYNPVEYIKKCTVNILPAP